jgi:hypothetical protein
MALSETLKDLTEGISSLRNQTYKLGDRYMQGEDIMKDGMGLRNMLKNMDIEITKLEGTSRKDNPSVYDVEVEQYTSDEAGKLKNRLGELMNATSDFDEAPRMFDGGMLTGVIGGPVDVEKLDESRTVPGIIKETYSDPMLRLISGQRAGFYPQLGFGADPYENVFKRALGIPVAEAPTTPPPDRPPYIPPPDGPPFRDPRDGDFYDPRDDYLRDRFLDFRDADLFDFTPIGTPDTPKVPMDFDPAAFREDILSNIPAYDPSELEKGIASLQEQIGSFKPPTLDIGQITRDIQSQLKLPQTPQIDVESLRRDILSQVPQTPQIDIGALRQDILSRVPQFDPSSIQQGLASLESRLQNIPQVNLDPITSRLAQLEKQLAGLSTPSVSIPNFRNFTLG